MIMTIKQLQNLSEFYKQKLDITPETLVIVTDKTPIDLWWVVVQQQTLARVITDIQLQIIPEKKSIGDLLDMHNQLNIPYEYIDTPAVGSYEI